MTKVLLGLAAIAGAAAAYAVAGQAGLFGMIGLAALFALLAARLRIPPQPPGAGRARRAVFGRPAFGSYGQIELALAQAQASRRDFDLVTRPILQRLAAAVLADRRGIEMAANPGAARSALGEDLWSLLDPGRPACADSRAPGPDAATLAAIVDRLEGL